MKKIYKVIGGKNFSPKLKTQLILSFMAMFLIILSLGSIFTYSGMLNILKRQSEQSTLAQFHQSEYNINTLKNETDNISKQFIISAELQKLLEYRDSQDIKRVDIVNSIYEKFSQILMNYQYVDSVYYYGENGIIVGVTSYLNVFENNRGLNNWFYKSEVYKMAKKNKLKQVWYGGYSSSNFNNTKYDVHTQSNKTNYLITSARGINQLGKQIGTLVINVNERYFTSIYNNTNNTLQSTIYITDNSGKIISHKEESKIGKESILGTNTNFDSKNRSYTLKNGKETNQVIYSKIDSLGWILVNEIPIRIFQSDMFTLKKIVLLMFFASLFAAFILSIYWIYSITRPLNKLTDVMNRMENGKIGITLDEAPRNELGIIGKQFNKMSKSIMELIKQNEAIYEEKRRVEIEVLQAQINPHFLYNTLNTIKWMAIVIKAENIVESITTLSNILRPIFKSHTILCPIGEEIEYINNYVKIMNYRFGEGIKFNFSIPDDILKCEILRFILQPLIENALTHGMITQNGFGKISVIALQEGEDIVLTVSDDGHGITQQKLMEINNILTLGIENNEVSENGIGLVNVNRRIKLHFGREYGIKVNSIVGVGTDILLKIPKVQKT